MKRKVVGVALFCFVLFAAILAGYWDMLNAEKLRQVGATASDTVGELGAALRPTPETPVAPATADDANPVGTATLTPPSSEAEKNTALADAGRTIVAEGPDPRLSPAPAPASPSAPMPGSISAPTSAPPPMSDAASPPPVLAGPAEKRAAVPSEPAAAGASPSTPAPSVSSPGAAAGAAGTILPTFDILRVEPDGSTVLAGRAPAGAKVSLSDGKTALGSDTANAEGAFVVVLEQRLPVGEHQIKIEATLPDGATVASAETAIVSIPPAGRESELLAMVEAPDKASRLITLPAPAAAQTPAMAARPEAAAIPGEAAVSLQPASPSPADQAPAVAEATLAVEAVEIEDETIYIAGRVGGSASVRVYVDDTLLAETSPTAEDRFLVTARRSLAIGDHTVRADALDRAGDVLARVEVPFFKPEGRAMSAVAPDGGSTMPPAESAAESSASSAAAGGAETAAATPQEPAPASPGETSAPSSGASDAPAGSDAVTAESDSPQPTEAAAVPLPSKAEASASAAGAETAIAAPTVVGEAADASRGARVKTVPAPAPITAEALPTTRSNTPPAVSSSPAPGTVPAPASDEVEAAPTSGEVVPVTRQPALAAAGSRVIIRKGDTLWRISRETYGLGRRYTVIYLANGDQIRDPDRIYPGQVFRVPGDAATAATAAAQ